MSGGRGGMPGGGMPAGGPGGGQRMNPAAMRAMRRIVRTVPTRLDIQRADSAIVVKRELGDDLELKTKASWHEGWIVVTRSVRGGGSVKESLMASVDGRRLTVSIEIGGGRGGDTMTFHRVYDRRGESSR